MMEVAENNDHIQSLSQRPMCITAVLMNSFIEWRSVIVCIQPNAVEKRCEV